MSRWPLPWPALLILGLDAGCFQGADSATSATGSASAAATSSTSTDTRGPEEDSASTSSGGPGGTASTSTTATTTAADPSSSSTRTTATTSSSDAICGDGEVSGDEECDDGPANDDKGLCTTKCTKAACNDGILQPDNEEECDDGLGNAENAACTDTCTLAVCGDGKTWEGHEECDDGPDNQAGVYDGCDPMTCEKGPHCGDEIKQPPEECDSGAEKNGQDGEICGESCKLQGKIVFATSKTYTGALGGLVGADDKCNTLAIAAQLANAGNFKAWLSDEESSAAERMSHHAAPYVLLDSSVIAESWEDLTDGALAAKILVDEHANELVKSSGAWTGTDASGEREGPDCDSWTKGDLGTAGDLVALDAKWSAAGPVDCKAEFALLCIEQ
ncbi:MAG: DUF1554 domain-containing protein [Nannocystaceae bacterium]